MGDLLIEVTLDNRVELNNVRDKGVGRIYIPPLGCSTRIGADGGA